MLACMPGALAHYRSLAAGAIGSLRFGRSALFRLPNGPLTAHGLVISFGRRVADSRMELKASELFIKIRYYTRQSLHNGLISGGGQHETLGFRQELDSLQFERDQPNLVRLHTATKEDPRPALCRTKQ